MGMGIGMPISAGADLDYWLLYIYIADLGYWSMASNGMG